MKYQIIPFLFVISGLSCGRSGGDPTGPVKGGQPPVEADMLPGPHADTSCTTDAECVLSTRTFGCCSDCGTAPEEYIGIHVNEKKGRFAREQAECEKSRADCPLVNCPVIKYCNEPKAFCKAGRCAMQLIPIPDCAELRYDMPAAPTGG